MFLQLPKESTFTNRPTSSLLKASLIKMKTTQNLTVSTHLTKAKTKPLPTRARSLKEAKAAQHLT